jgi:hypothetical protein
VAGDGAAEVDLDGRERPGRDGDTSKMGSRCLLFPLADDVGVTAALRFAEPVVGVDGPSRWRRTRACLRPARKSPTGTVDCFWYSFSSLRPPCLPNATHQLASPDPLRIAHFSWARYRAKQAMERSLRPLGKGLACFERRCSSLK